MESISYSTARRNLAATIEAVVEDHMPIVITKGSNCAVVMLSLEDFTDLQKKTSI